MMKQHYGALVGAAALVATLGLAGCGSPQPQAPANDSAAQSATKSETTEKNEAPPAAEQTAAPAESTAPTQTAAPAQDSYIGDQAAKDIALQDAGVAEADAIALQVELDLDDAVVHYSVDFKSNGMDYEYDIDATTGDIITKTSEVDD